MNCPACARDLQQVTVDDVTVDLCRGGCGGVWFDRFELQKFDEPHEELGRELLHVRTDTGSSVNPDKRLSCPKCDATVMMRHYFSVKRQVEVDECPSCAGYWLEVGELRGIRFLYDSEEERRKAAAEYFEEVFGDQLHALGAESAGRGAKARQIANLFRFVCPSYYIPGKQAWGAF